jgi:hypothetical protein
LFGISSGKVAKDENSINYAKKCDVKEHMAEPRESFHCR